MAPERLDKLLVSTGRWTRREAKALIRAGRVQVDGVPAHAPEEKAEPDAAVTVDGERLEALRGVWVMLNKPAGYLTASEDRHAPTVMDLLPLALRRRLFPVGRLDKATEGLLLFTDDGAAAHRLLSPRGHVDKEYHARVEGELTEADRAAFRAGLVLPDGLQCLPAELEIIRADAAQSECRVTVREGKFHQVRRMLAAVGNPVLTLERIRIGGVPLDLSLSRGSFRFLTDAEAEALFRAT